MPAFIPRLTVTFDSLTGPETCFYTQQYRAKKPLQPRSILDSTQSNGRGRIKLQTVVTTRGDCRASCTARRGTAGRPSKRSAVCKPEPRIHTPWNNGAPPYLTTARLVAVGQTERRSRSHAQKPSVSEERIIGTDACVDLIESNLIPVMPCQASSPSSVPPSRIATHHIRCRTGQRRVRRCKYRQFPPCQVCTRGNRMR